MADGYDRFEGEGGNGGGSSESMRGSHTEPSHGSQPGGSSTGGSRRS